MRLEAQIIRLSEPLLDSFETSLAPLPASDSFARKIFGSPVGGPLGAGLGAAVGLGVGPLCDSVLVLVLGLGAAPGGDDRADSMAGAGPAAAVSSEGRKA